MSTSLHDSTLEVVRLSSEKRTSGSNDAPRWTLSRPLRVRGALVSAVTIPNTMYTIDAGSNDTINTSAGVATIPAGVYTIGGLATAAQTALQAVDATFTCTYSTLTLKYTIARPVAFSLLWTAAAPGASYRLGFTPAVAGPAVSFVGDRAVSGSEPSAVLLRSSELSHGSAPGFTVDGRTGSDIARVPLTGALGLGASSFIATDFFEELSYGTTGTVITELGISLADAISGLPISLNGAPWSVEITMWVNEHKKRLAHHV